MEIKFILLILLLTLTTSSSCDRENVDILLEETEEPIDPEVSNYAIDHVFFNNNDYVNTDLATASECELYDEFTGDYLNNFYLITNLDGIDHEDYEFWDEGDFYLFYDFEDGFFHHANIMVESADTLTLACPLEININLEIEDNEKLAGTFSGEFFIFDNSGFELISIGMLSGNFHVPLVPCE